MPAKTQSNGRQGDYCCQGTYFNNFIKIYNTLFKI